MDLLAAIEDSALADYIRVAPYGYAPMIALHSLGLAVMVGLSVVTSLRALGLFAAIPFSTLRRFIGIAWAGFLVNLVSGALLFAAQATTYVRTPEFLVKMLFVLLGAAFVALLQAAVRDGPDSNAAPRSSERRLYALASLGSWAVAMIAGRLIAYA